MMQPKSRVKIVSEETLSNGWTRLSSYLLDYIDRRGATQQLKREVYHRTPAACVLLYDPKRDLVVLVRQFRLAVHLNGDPAWIIEVPAGLLDDDHPEQAIRREAMEETGYQLRDARFLFKCYTSPGAFAEVVHFFVSVIDIADRVAEGGGLDEEHEDIEVLEIPLDEAARMIETGEIFDAKTIMLLQWALLNRNKLR
ncbi:MULTISPECIES: NUDIX domain-containing protein [Rhizobium]|uniref:GDP-mannose pyrophosphatase n=1 Tax=Rhizobium hidalgonense TaxID=1538159 RepID=A0A2A6K6X1_9HYPH|nr:NUDIX domain-containing protein [Rhizobium hidalgonense]EJC73221.1 protein containing C-terminal region of TrgB protein [Rhizobium leguminosarum bv. trifolii WSM2012]MDR9776351.1 NUDIX domain-containing protein [Rhizobium hidalgonense]MDR9806322.1 NUDIX domain-containing protein [Rhizobium hidalgonense]MDR9812416.1 NUDIX domain-containing protein [Rhizobium hidalgonense]MDR9822961.1 NUDIX domain-containing protein [Rhizobium hidalgonense]